MIQNRTGYPGPIFFVLSFLRLRPHLKHALSSLQQLRSRERESVKSFSPIVHKVAISFVKASDASVVAISRVDRIFIVICVCLNNMVQSKRNSVMKQVE